MEKQEIKNSVLEVLANDVPKGTKMPSDRDTEESPEGMYVFGFGATAVFAHDFSYSPARESFENQTPEKGYVWFATSDGKKYGVIDRVVNKEGTLGLVVMGWLPPEQKH